MKIVRDDSGIMKIKESGLFFQLIGVIIVIFSFAILTKRILLDEGNIFQTFIFLVIFGSVFIFVGSERKNFLLDKNTHTITISTKSFLKKSIKQQNLNDIKAVISYASPSIESRGKYSLVLKTNTEDILLTTYNQKSSEKRKKEEIGKRIAAFLGKSLEEENISVEEDIQLMMNQNNPETSAKQQEIQQRVVELAGKVSDIHNKITKVKLIIFLVVAVLIIITLITSGTGKVSSASCTNKDMKIKIEYREDGTFKGSIRGIPFTNIEADFCNTFLIEEERFSSICQIKPKELFLNTEEGLKTISLEPLKCQQPEE